MTKKDIKKIICPYCESTIDKINIIEKFNKSKHIKYAVVSCKCDQFPIYEGLLIFKRNQKEVISLILAKKYHQALAYLNDLRKMSRRTFILAKYLIKFGEKINLKPQIIFKLSLRLMQILSFNNFEFNWFGYLTKRNQAITFNLQQSTFGLLKNQQTILEFGCGGGQFSYYIKDSFPYINLFLIDEKFWLLNLAYSSGQIPLDSNVIVLNVTNKLPLKKNCCDLIYANDAMSYIDYQKQFIQEVKRVIKSKTGIFVAMHIHNQGAINIAECNAISPKLLLEWIKMKYHFIGDDKKIWNYLQKKQKLVLDNKSDINFNKKTKSFSIICSQTNLKLQHLQLNEIKENYQDVGEI